ncbi:MAG TPA: glycoside hydrolase family 15 protein [Candidatus Binatia bacterium]|nr:glycoside hydrolase family 15 protein [Candidatus Binatia bacterium]
MITHSIQLLNQLRYPTGLFAAAQKNVATGYSRAWMRDNIYATLGLEALGDYAAVLPTYHALLDIMRKHESKIDWMIQEPSPKHAYRYIHARYDPLTGNEILEEWGNKQNDAVGALLFKIGDLHKKGVPVIRDQTDLRIIQKLVDYLASIEYWHDADNGMWEEAEEVHASSVGACVAGLEAVKHLVNVPQNLVSQGRLTLSVLLPRESKTKHVDLALLSLIYPYNIVTEEQKQAILKNVEELLVREKGVLRYLGDKYYSNGSEAEWTMGLPWLAIIYKNQMHKHRFYMEKTLAAMNEQGELPELYFGGTKEHNENTPLGWAQSLYVVAAQ